MEARNDYIITRKAQITTRKELVNTFNVNVPQKDLIVAVGAGVEFNKVGDVIIFDDRQSIPFEYEGERYIATPERNVVAKVGHSE